MCGAQGARLHSQIRNKLLKPVALRHKIGLTIDLNEHTQPARSTQQPVRPPVCTGSGIARLR